MGLPGSVERSHRTSGTGGFVLYVLPTVAYAAAILLLGMAPPQGGSGLEGQDKLFHLIAFGVMTLMMTRSVRFLWPSWRCGRQIVTAAGIAMGLGILLEILQGFTPHRQPELGDIVADLAGVLLMALGLAATARFARATSGDER